jgi:hypothetical protein
VGHEHATIPQVVVPVPLAFPICQGFSSTVLEQWFDSTLSSDAIVVRRKSLKTSEGDCLGQKLGHDVRGPGAVSGDCGGFSPVCLPRGGAPDACSPFVRFLWFKAALRLSV